MIWFLVGLFTVCTMHMMGNPDEYIIAHAILWVGFGIMTELRDIRKGLKE